MSLLIKGMDMPREGTVMVVCEVNGQPCVVVRGAEPYPLVRVPPHGRLIDADALLETEAQHWITEYNSDGYAADEIGAYTMTQIDAMPTIIPADKEAKE